MKIPASFNKVLKGFENYYDCGIRAEFEKEYRNKSEIIHLDADIKTALSSVFNTEVTSAVLMDTDEKTVTAYDTSKIKNGKLSTFSVTFYRLHKERKVVIILQKM